MCSDPSKIWYPYRDVCYPSMEEAAARRQYEALHEARPYHDGKFTRWSEHLTAATPYHYGDGVHIGVAEIDVNPSDEFLKPSDPFADPDPDQSQEAL